MRITTFIIISFLLLYFNSGRAQEKLSITDTSSLKKLVYDEVNDVVSYHIINQGHYSDAPNLIYIVKPIAVYRDGSHSFEKLEDNKEFYLKKGELKKYILTDRFSERLNFHGIFKLNSKVLYIWRPGILEKISVLPKLRDIEHARLLMKKLRAQNYVRGTSLDSMESFSIRFSSNSKLNHHKKDLIYVRIKLKSKYANIDSLKEISNKLKKLPEVANAIYVESPTGITQSDTYVDITSEKRIFGKKSIVKSDTSSWGKFLQTLK